MTAWDKLGMFGIASRGRRWGKFPIALVKAEVGLPVKSGGAAKMRLAAVMISPDDGKTWTWATLGFFSWFDDSQYVD